MDLKSKRPYCLFYTIRQLGSDLRDVEEMEIIADLVTLNSNFE